MSAPTADACSSPGVAAIQFADFELTAGERSIFVVTAPAGRGLEPDAGSAEKRTAGRPASLVVGEQGGHDVGTIRLEPLPGVLPDLVEHVVERRLE